MFTKNQARDLLSFEFRDIFGCAKDSLEASQGKIECKLHVPTHLLTALKTSFRLGAYSKSCHILLYLIQTGQCSKQFVWQILATLFIKTSWQRSLEFSELAGVFSKFTAFPSLEVNAVVIFNMIRNGQYDRAYDEIFRCEGLVPSDSNPTHSLLVSMLLIYKYILQLYVTNFEHQSHMDHQMTMETLLSKSYLLPLIAEACIVSLARPNEHGKKKRINDKAKVEKFIYRYIESESNANWGVSGQEHTLAILNAHSFRVSENVKFNILEEISQRDPGNAKVLELCKIHLILDQKPKQRSFKQESDIGTESEMSDTEDPSDSENLKACLELLFNFLDTHMYKQVTSPIREGWSLLADVLRRVCIKGAYSCVKELANIWHLDRKDWWICFRNLKADKVDELVRNKALICYLLESDSHPFVQKSLSLNNSSHLRSLIKQFHPSKYKMDEVIKSFLGNKKDCRQLLVNTPQKDIPSIESRAETFLSKYEHINSQKIAEEFSHHMNRQPLVSKQQYKREATAQLSTMNLYQLPISERLSKRYEHRRASTPRSWRSTEGSEPCSPNGSDSSEREDPLWKAPEYLERDLAKNDANFKEACLDKSSDSKSYVPSGGNESNTEIDWTTKLRSWCAKEGATCYESQTLCHQFVTSYESFKAKEFRGQETVNTFCWQEFLNDGTWQEPSEYDSSEYDSSENDSSCSHSNSDDSCEAQLNFESDDLSPSPSFVKILNPEDINSDQRLHNSSARSVCSSITDYPNSMDRILRRLGAGYEESCNGRTEDAEYVVEGYVDEIPLTSSKIDLDERDVCSPDMFTEHESEFEMLTSTPPDIVIQNAVDNVTLFHEAHEDTDTSTKLTAKVNQISPSHKEATQVNNQTKNKSVKVSKSARKKLSKERRTSKFEIKETDEECSTIKHQKHNEVKAPKTAKIAKNRSSHKRRNSETKEDGMPCKSPKRKRMHRSWMVDESKSNPKIQTISNQSTEIIQPTFAIRKRTSKSGADISRASSDAFESSKVASKITKSEKFPISPLSKKNHVENVQTKCAAKIKREKRFQKSKVDVLHGLSEPTSNDEMKLNAPHAKHKRNSSSGELRNWSVDLVEKILSERRKSK